MNSMLKVILAVYRFFVGDLVILLGVTLTMVILALIAGVLVTLLATLGREVMRAENKEKV